MIGELITTKDAEGIEKVSNASLSLYSPPQEVKVLTLAIKHDYQTGNEIMNRPFEEFNDMSLIERMNIDQKRWNTYVPAKSTDPDKSWRWNGVSEVVRNKIISTAAHLTAAMMYPGIFAQNDKDEEDKLAAGVMRDMVEWNIQNSDYALSFMFGVIAGLVNPVAYIHIDYIEVLQTIKERMLSGEITPKQVVDEVMSGLQIHNIPAEEILIENPYQYYIQKQKFLIRRRTVTHGEMGQIYGEHPNFTHVKPGIQVLYNEGDALFYDKSDEENPNMVEEVIYYNRLEDIEVPYVNGIYLGEENVAANPIKHRDNQNRPKYSFVKYGSEPIDAKRFFFYRSLAMKMANKYELASRTERLAVDGTFLEVMFPTAVFGADKMGSSITFPGSMSNFPRDARVEAVGTGRNLRSIYDLMEMTDKRIDESTQSQTRTGQAEPGDKTKFEIQKLEENARISLGVIGRMMVEMVADMGELIVDIVLAYQTIGDVGEVVGDNVEMKYKTFLLADQQKEGRKITKKIIFDQGLIGKAMTEKEKLKASFGIMKEGGGRDSDQAIYRVNPPLFSKLKFLIRIDPEAWQPKDKFKETLLKLQAHARMIESPYADRKAIDRDFLFEPLAEGDADKYMLDEIPRELQELGIAPGQTPKKEGIKPLEELV